MEEFVMTDNRHVLEEVIEKFWNQSKTVRLLSSRNEWFLPLRLRNTTGPKAVVCGTLDVNCEGMEEFVMTDNRLRAVRKEIYLARISNENVEIPDVMNTLRYDTKNGCEGDQSERTR